MSFIVLDLSLLVLCCIALGVFFYKNKKGFSKEGPMYLYRTQWGVKFIDWTSRRYGKFLGPLQYAVLVVSYVLMVVIVWLISYSTYIYFRYPAVAEAVRAPPLFPVFPYFTKFFGLSSFFPDFTFSAFVIALAVVAISHEFSHGIFARFNKVKIHSTGFGFLRLFSIPLPFLGAFVEQDDKQMWKTSKFGQLAILGAGVFANVIMTLLFCGILWIFFLGAFNPTGFQFQGYAQSGIASGNITSINGYPISNISNWIVPEDLLSLNEIYLQANGKKYYANPVQLQAAIKAKAVLIGVYDDSPAYNSKLPSVIISLDGQKTNTFDEFVSVLSTKSPGQNVLIKALNPLTQEENDYSITLSEREGKAFLGVGFSPSERKGLINSILSMTPKIKNPFTGTYSESVIGEAGTVLFYILWWTVLINILVALFNMLPLGILDGGRFFLVSVWAITGNKKTGEKSYTWASRIVMFMFLLLMIRWAMAFFF